MKSIYQPAEDSYLLQSLISKYSEGKSVLDIGTGSGILAETALRNKASSVLACDISSEVIKELKAKKFPVIKSNLFSKISKKFDLILFNPPYLAKDIDEPKSSRLATTGGNSGDEIIIRFLKESPNYLNKNGIILLLLSSLTPRKRILEVLKSSKLKYKKVAEKKIFFEILEVWEIKEL